MQLPGTAGLVDGRSHVKAAKAVTCVVFSRVPGMCRLLPQCLAVLSVVMPVASAVFTAAVAAVAAAGFVTGFAPFGCAD